MHRRLCIPIVALLLLASGCTSSAVDGRAEFRYKPPGLPITFAIDSSFRISVSVSAEVATPLGQFSIVGAASIEHERDDDWIIGLALDGGPVHVYRVHSKLDLVIESGPNDGFLIEASERRLLLAVTGADSVVINDRSAGTYETFQSPVSTEPLPEPAVAPTLDATDRVGKDPICIQAWGDQYPYFHEPTGECYANPIGR